MNTARRLTELSRRVMPPLLALLVVAVAALVHFKRGYVAGDLSGESLDTLQAVRYFARTGQFGTFVIRPLVSGFMPFRGDGSQPDLAHAPLYTVLAGAAMRLLHQTGANAGDQPAVLVSLAAWAASIVAVFLLARRLFVTNRIAALAAAFYALSSGLGLKMAITPHPATLAALTFVGLFWCLARLGTRQNEPPLGGREAALCPGGAGLLAGLLFLSAYSAIVLVPLFAWHIGRVCGRARGMVAVPVFLGAFLIAASPMLWRNFKETRNPLFQARGLELIMQTETNPGYELYRSATLGQSVGQFLSSGGYKQIVKKAAAHAGEYAERLPGAFGIALLPLYLGAALVRFDDGRTNRLRTLAYRCVVVQFAGLSLFGATNDAVPLLLPHIAVGAVFGAGLLHALVRARNLPGFAGAATIWGWGLLVCAPGVFAGGAGRTAPLPPAWDIFGVALDPQKSLAPRLAPVRTGQALLVSESPQEWAFRCDLPTVWLPRTAGDLSDVADRAGLPVAAVILTPTLATAYQSDDAAASWLTTYDRLTALWTVAAPLTPGLRQTLIGKTTLFYPPDISPAVATFRPEPFAEAGNTKYTFLFWNPAVVRVRSGQ